MKQLKQTEEQKRGFLLVLLGTLAASMLEEIH